MNWYNLRKNKCPKCNKDFMKGLTTTKIGEHPVFNHKCGFRISELKFKIICTDTSDKVLQNLTDTFVSFDADIVDL